MPGGAYLVRQAKQFISAETVLKNGSTTGSNDFEDEFNFVLEEDPFEATCTIERPLVTEHHVLWSVSYSVPVLYFNGWKSDFPGINPVSVEEAQSLVRGTELKYSDLSQAIHPQTGTPFLHLHPCMSRELLQVTSKSKNQLVSWLSTMAPVALGLRMRQEYFQLTF